jgi:hypothetical protein
MEKEEGNGFGGYRGQWARTTGVCSVGAGGAVGIWKGGKRKKGQKLMGLCFRINFTLLILGEF